MKVRTGFVSNSSASSFLIYGVYAPSVSVDKLLAIEGLEQKWAAWYKGKQENYPWYPNTTFADWAEGEGGVELLDGLGQFTDIFNGVDCEGPDYDDDYMGMDPRQMDDDETMGQFKQRVKDVLSLIIDEDFKCEWHKYAWRA